MFVQFPGDFNAVNYYHINTVRTAGPPKKVAALDAPTIAIGYYQVPQHAGPGTMVVSATCKMIYTLCIYDSKSTTSLVHVLNEKHKTSYTLGQVRHLCGAKPQSSLYCVVVLNVELMDHQPTIECRMRNGWGMATVPMFKTKAIDSWMRKRPFESMGGRPEPEATSKAARSCEDANLPNGSVADTGIAVKDDMERVDDDDEHEHLGLDLLLF